MSFTKKDREQLIAEWRGYYEAPSTSDRTVRPADVLPQILKKLGMADRLDEKIVLKSWLELVGPFIAQNATPDRLKDGVLFVRVLQPSLHYELDRVWKKKILDKFQEAFGKKKIRAIQFSVH